MTTARALVAFALIPIAMLVHVLLARYFGWFQKWPIAELVVMAAAVIVLLRLMVNSVPFRKGLLVLNVVAWVLVGFFLWWTQAFAAYDELKPTVADGQATSEIVVDGLLDEEGAAVDVGELLAQSEATLLVFYRGHW